MIGFCLEKKLISLITYERILLIPSRHQIITVVRVFRPVKHANLKVRTTLIRYPLNATWY